VRAWNDELEWVLISAVPGGTSAEGCSWLGWCAFRWICEEYHKALKTGCAVEKRRLETAERLQNLLGFLGPLAVRLLHLRQEARANPDAPATAVIPEPIVRVLATFRNLDPRTLTLRRFAHETAKPGGFLGRKRHGEHGWQTLWLGFLRLIDIAIGMNLVPFNRPQLNYG
jgi:hypothetical protein